MEVSTGLSLSLVHELVVRYPTQRIMLKIQHEDNSSGKEKETNKMTSSILGKGR